MNVIDRILFELPPGIHATDPAGYLRFGSGSEGSGAGISTRALDFLLRDSTLLKGIASYTTTDVTIVAPNRRPLRQRVATIYGSFFELLGVRASAGRVLTSREIASGNELGSVVLSDELAARIFGSATAAPGQRVRLDGHLFTVLGVAPRGFFGPDRTVPADMWVPWGALSFGDSSRRRPRNLDAAVHSDLIVAWDARVPSSVVAARIRTTLLQAGAMFPAGTSAVDSLEARIYPGLQVSPARRSSTRRTVEILLVIGFLVLGTTCANACNLLLLRNERRAGLLVLQVALGASPSRLIRQHLLLALFICTAATGVALVLSSAMLLPFRHAELEAAPILFGVRSVRSMPVIGLVLVAGIVIGITTIPAIRFVYTEPLDALRRSAAHLTTSNTRLISAIVSTQLALCFSVVVGALLLIATLTRLSRVDQGFDEHGVIVVAVPYAGLGAGTTLDDFGRRLLSTIKRVPGVIDVGFSPYGVPSSTILGRIALSTDSRGIEAAMVPVTPSWFNVLRIKAASGRLLRTQDQNSHSPRAIVLTESLARRLFGTRDPLGQRVIAGFGRVLDAEVVGVLSDLRSPYEPGQPLDAFFVSYAFDPSLPFDWLTVVARIRADNSRTIEAIGAAAQSLVPSRAIADAETLEHRLSAIHAETRVLARLLTMLAGTALALAAAGLFGAVGAAVGRRRRECAIRAALGADQWDLVRLVAREVAGMLTWGGALGFVAAYAVSTMLRSRLFGVGPNTSGPYAVGLLMLILVSVLASWSPVRAAARADARIALESE